MKQLLVALLVLLLAFSMATLFIEIPNVKAAITKTLVFYTSASDGYSTFSSSSYATAHDSTGGSPYSTGYMWVGQGYSSPLYYPERAFLFFDTSAIPNPATINSAVLSINIAQDSSTTDFNVTLQTGGSTYPHNPLEWGDYYYAYYSGNGGSRNTSAITGTGYWNITLNSNGLSWVNIFGATKLCLRSSRDINSEVPTGAEHIALEYAEKGASYAAKLYVTYTVATTDVYTYNLHGPFLEDGTVFNGIVNASMYYLNQATGKYLFNGTDGVADDVQIYSALPAINVAWNITNDATEKRVYYFDQSAPSGEVWLYVPDVNNPFVVTHVYGISIADLAGLTNAYVETQRYVDGYMKTIERRPLDPINPMPFTLITFETYQLKIVSDQGSFVFTLIADAVTSKSFAITYDMLPQIISAYNFTVTATRPNAGNLTFYFYDASSKTTSVTSTILYYSSGELIEYYSQTDSGSTQFYTVAVWPEVNYYVQVSAEYGDETLAWLLTAPAPGVVVQFDLTDGLNLFGSWPVPVRSMFGLFIVLIFFGIGSYKDSEFFAGVAALVALFLWAIGLLMISLAAISMALVIVAWMYFHKGKQEMREI